MTAAGSQRERLAKLVCLANQPDAAAGELSAEVADLLLDWPRDYPASLREPFEALLERSLDEIGPERRAALADRFAATEAMPLVVVNALFFDACANARDAILARNAQKPGFGPLTEQIDEAVLIADARVENTDIAPVLARHFRLDPETAARIARDASGYALATLCRGGRCARATFSALAVLANPSLSIEEAYGRLSMYETVKPEGAAGLIGFWQAAHASQANGPITFPHAPHAVRASSQSGWL